MAETVLSHPDMPISECQNIFSEKDAAGAPLEKLTKKGQPMNTVINKADIRRAQFAVENASIASISTSSLRIDLPIVNSGKIIYFSSALISFQERNLYLKECALVKITVKGKM